MSGWHKHTSKSDEEYDPEKAARGEYTARDLERFADQMLRQQANAVDPDTGKRRGIDGENPILFAEHEYARKRREIFTESGTPDPSLVSGIYNRTHPQGRKVNSEEQRRRNGASFYR